ncbi:MAG: hypothetical protein WDM89_15005 [Rhizomicrobium sp.]
MRKTITIAAALTFVCGAAFAQTDSQQGPNNAAVKGMHDNNSSAPVAGANSFTMSQAKAQIEAKGYTHVVHLKKAKTACGAVWRRRTANPVRSAWITKATSTDFRTRERYAS